MLTSGTDTPYQFSLAREVIPSRARGMLFAAVLVLASASPLPARENAGVIKVDASTSLGTYPNIVSTVAGPIRSRLGRIGGVWYYHQMDEVVRNKNGSLTCKWDKIDPDVDKLLSGGEDLVMLFGYTPTAIVDAPRRTSFCLSIGLNAAPPKSYIDWEEICYQAVRHFNVERGLAIRYWEVWNEPNATGFWPGTFAEYLELYKSAAGGTKRADRNAKIGGPVVTVGGPLSIERPPVGDMPVLRAHQFKQPVDWKATAVPDFTNYSKDSPYELMATFIDYCAKNKVPLDFLVWHNYNDAPGLDVHNLDSFGANAALFRSWLDRFPRFREAEMIVDEWGVLNATDALTDSVFCCAAAMEMAKSGVLCTYPSFCARETANALTILSALGPRRVRETSDAGLRVLATSSPSGRVDILIARLDKSEGAQPIDVKLDISGLARRKHLRWERFVLDARHKELLSGGVGSLQPVEKAVLPVAPRLQRALTVAPRSLNLVRVW